MGLFREVFAGLAQWATGRHRRRGRLAIGGHQRRESLHKGRCDLFAGRIRRESERLPEHDLEPREPGQFLPRGSISYVPMRARAARHAALLHQHGDTGPGRVEQAVRSARAFREISDRLAIGQQFQRGPRHRRGRVELRRTGITPMLSSR